MSLLAAEEGDGLAGERVVVVDLDVVVGSDCHELNLDLLFAQGRTPGTQHDVVHVVVAQTGVLEGIGVDVRLLGVDAGSWHSLYIAVQHEHDVVHVEVLDPVFETDELNAATLEHHGVGIALPVGVVVGLGVA